MEVRKLPGTVISNTATNEVIYTPPVGEDVIRDLLGNWEQFLHADDDLDPLIKMAISHYQFEAIHPFHDGNGRTGRILNVLYLIEQELLTLPILYLSRYIVQNKSEYYRLLIDVTGKGRWTEWIRFMLDGVAQVSSWTVLKIAAIRSLMDETTRHCHATNGLGIPEATGGNRRVGGSVCWQGKSVFTHEAHAPHVDGG